MIFPGGRIEPDPEVHPGAIDSLRGWSKSTGLLVRLVSSVRVVPVIVRGVLSKRAIRHPLTRLRRLEKDRERLGAMLQIILPAFRTGRVRVAFGEPLQGEALLESTSDLQEITARIIKEARSLIEFPPDGWRPLSTVIDAEAAHGGPDDRDLVACGNDF